MKNKCMHFTLFKFITYIFAACPYMHISLQFRISALEYNVINNSLNLGDIRYCKSGYFHWWCLSNIFQRQTIRMSIKYMDA